MVPGNHTLICGVSVFMDSVSFSNLSPKQNIYSLNRGIMILVSMNIKIIKSTNFRQPRIQAHSQYLFYNVRPISIILSYIFTLSGE